MRTRTANAALAALCLMPCVGGCGTIGVPGFGPEAGTAPADAPVQTASLVVGESGLAAGIPAAIQVFGDALEEDALATRRPTLFPRGLPQTDAGGEDFADRVSIAPDGRRLAVGTQRGDRFEVQIVGVNRKAVERTITVPGDFDFVGWSGPRAVLFGYEANSTGVVETLDLRTGRRRVLDKRGTPPGVLATGPDGAVVTVRPGRDAFACADGRSLPRAYDGMPVTQAGPLDPQGRIVFATGPDAERGALVPYDCSNGAFAEPIYEGRAFGGALADTAGGGYVAVWDADGVRYLDPSLAYEMGEVAASFPAEVEVWPIEFTRSPNTLLLYVSGDETPPSYYVLDRYAGALDLHVSYEGDGRAE